MAADLKSLVEWKKSCPITAMQLDIRELQTQNKMRKFSDDTVWDDITPRLAKELHSPEHRTRDELVAKLVNHTITLEELKILDPLLDHEANNGNDKRRYAAAMLRPRVLYLIHVQEDKS
jgi:hypothetical protein